MNYRVTHRTEYRYAAPVAYCHNEARLLPRRLPHQTCLTARVDVDPIPADYSEREDFFGNRVCYFSIQQPHERLTVSAISEVSVGDRDDVPADESDTPWDAVRDALMTAASPECLAVRQFLLDSPLVPASADFLHYAQPFFTPGRPLLEAVLDLMGRVHAEFQYDPGFTTVSTPLAEVMRHRRGVCQDFAHLAIGCLRAVGLATRYVSGYLETLPPPGQARLLGADASHAWCSVFLPEVGWIDFDPTNNQMPFGQHITTAWGRDFSDVTPLKGIIFGGGSGHQLAVSVAVEKLGGDD